MTIKIKLCLAASVLLGLSTMACEGAKPKVFESMDGRTVTWDNMAITLNNKSSVADAEKKFVVLSDVGRIPSSGPLIFENATLNKISSKVHNCGGSVESNGSSITISINGSSDRCKMFNGTWHAQGGALEAAKTRGFVPQEYLGSYTKDGSSDTLKITVNQLLGKHPGAYQAHDKKVQFSLNKGDTVNGSLSIAGTLNVINGRTKTCSGTLTKEGSDVIVALSGTSGRCRALSGTWK